MPTYSLTVHRQDGTRVPVALNAALRLVVHEADGGTVEIQNSPDQTPPNGQLPVRFRESLLYALVPFTSFFGSSMDITTVARVKTQITGISGTSEDAFLQELITGVSAYFERYMRRRVLKQTNTEQIRLRRWKQVVALPGVPIESVTSIKYCDHPTSFAAATAMAATEYVILEDGSTGVIEFLNEMPFSPGFLQVVYVGGMAEDQAELELAYPELVQAADIQCAHEFMRRATPGGNVSSSGGSTSFDFSAVELVPRVRAVLDGFRRHYIGA